MKKISLSEFRDYFVKHSFNKIMFATDNQDWNNVDSTVAMELEFDDMLIAFNPNIIYLRDSTNSMCIKRVKLIKLPDDDCMLGRVFTVVCGNLHTKSNDKEYTLIAR